MIAASAKTLSRDKRIRHLLSGGMIDGCSILVVGARPAASVVIICRVDAIEAAKHVTIPAQKGLGKTGFPLGLSVILFNKVKNLGLICRE